MKIATRDAAEEKEKENKDEITLSVGDSLAEPVLWTFWVHHGLATAETEAAFVVLDAIKFHSCVMNNPVAMATPAYYATLFVKHLNKQLEDEVELTDLKDPSFDISLAVDLAFADPLELAEILEENTEEIFSKLGSSDTSSLCSSEVSETSSNDDEDEEGDNDKVTELKPKKKQDENTP